MKKETHKRYKDLEILYVDDEKANLSAFESLLEDTYTTSIFESPLRALDYAKSKSGLAVAFIDQVMPEMKGLEFAIELKRLRPTITCVMITGNATKQLAIDAVKQQVFFDFLEKPVDFSSSQFQSILDQALAQHLLESTKLEFRQGTLELLASLIDDKDGYTHFHSERVAQWSVKIGDALNLTERERLMLYEGALIHDLGKISIPDDILKKPGRLTALERRIIMTHPGRGGDLIERIPQLKQLSSMARDHHERPDGKGYPRGLKGDEIPVLTSIVALADFFEALSSKRVYKEPWAMADIVKELKANRGTQFREDVVDALLEVLEREGLWKEREQSVG